MIGNNKIFFSLFIFCLFSLTLFQVGLKISQSGQPNQILGVTTANSLLSCSNLYQFYQQNCSTTPLSTSPATNPDLTIDSITIEKVLPPESGCPQYRYTVSIKNIGSKNSPRSMVKTHLTPSQPQANDNCTQSHPFEGSISSSGIIAPNSVEKYSGYFNSSSSETITISAAVDYTDIVSESNENNNVLSQTFTVDAIWSPPLAPTLTPAAYCTAEPNRCLNSTTYQVCTNGRWQAFGCPENKQCSGNGYCLE